ncbi:MAG: DUF5906 domain-containing protein [Nanoarchaeota archaeon]|nr:DUF5906 domain-containing protein [Nanoarchaeota archaeon]
MLAELLGHNNVSFVKLDSFKSSSDFALEGLADKKLNVSDETNRSYIDSPVYTEATSEGTIKLNKKHGGMYDYTVKANFIIVGNFYPKFKDATGMQRRVVVVPFNHKLKPEEKILNIERRIAEKELSAIFN